MFVAYFDEVKHDLAAGRDHYFVGGVVVPMDKISEIEGRVADLANEIFGSRELVVETEFHTDFLFRGKGPFKGMDMNKRAELIGRLARIISGDACRRVFSAINVPGIYNPDYAPEYAFQHFVERLQMAVGEAPCLLIGDLDDEQARNMVKDFSKYRARGTPWAHGIMIRSLVDSVHFCRSHHSRMIQLADVYLWNVVTTAGFRQGRMVDMVKGQMADCDLFPTNYKFWPARD
jgi:hypothetical protein